MVRKRKIPARKHHGIRDPVRQKQKVEKSLKNVINNPPAQDDQKPSAKFSRFKKLLDDTKAGKNFKRPQLGREDKPKNAGNKKSDGSNKSGAIKQFVDESDGQYLRRVNRITSESVKEAQYEMKYGVNVIRDPKSGAITIQKRPKNEIDELLKQKAREKQAAKGSKGNRKKAKPAAKRIDPKLAKELIKQAIKEDDEERFQESSKELQEYQTDVIKFGEIVHAPPTLSTIPRKAQKSETVPRPGRKNNLLLKSMLGETNATAAPTTPSPKAVKTKANSDTLTKAQLKGKRKDLPAATRSMLENERLKMVEIYRQYKKTKEKERQ